ncbi:hypothetical protein PNOK_0673200 [Pyrrhoderma noxium]|uniref:Fungal-type protein kinase domain-containing protein n=1 Tax=Pyrrhoderma noxium TaxID=2282107 RepID=A0A286UF63_9AGAM|nr:hypothetical protein PNOK_0673200 [Pyrrhoderma noxium]
MGEGIRLAGSSNSVESPTREGSGAFGTTPSNNEASNVVHLDEIKKHFTLNQGFSLNNGRQESPGPIYTRSSFSGGSSSCRYNPYIRSITSSQPNPESDLQISRVSQNCIDFEEVATPFDNIDNINDMLLVTTDVLHTLRHVHSAGRIHRDISIGNIYLYNDRETQKKRGMIWNLEYVKEAGVGSQNNVRTGTPNFIAVEVVHQVYYFSKRPARAGKKLDDYIQEYKAYEKNRETNDTSKKVYYNYIHDLESVWWIVIWAFLNFEKKDARTDSYTTKRQRKLNKDKLFPGTIDNYYRFIFLNVWGSYSQTIECLPMYFKNLPTTLGTLADAITDIYRVKESNKKWNEKVPIVWDESSNIHETFICLLSRVDMKEFEMARVPGINVKTSHTPRIIDGIPPATQSNKRHTDSQDPEQCNKRQRFIKCKY